MLMGEQNMEARTAKQKTYRTACFNCQSSFSTVKCVISCVDTFLDVHRQEQGLSSVACLSRASRSTPRGRSQELPLLTGEQHCTKPVQCKWGSISSFFVWLFSYKTCIIRFNKTLKSGGKKTATGKKNN